VPPPNWLKSTVTLEIVSLLLSPMRYCSMLLLRCRRFYTLRLYRFRH
jgi:hypothetical protein